MFNSKIIKQILFILLFTVFGIIALQVKVSNLVGSNAHFTLFDSFAPITGVFLGPAWGVLSVLTMQVTNFIIHGSLNTDLGSIIRLIPTMFAVLYFARKTKLNFIIPIVAIVAFVVHPIGRTVWFYALFWMIPVVAYFYQEKYLIARSLGATFTAHAVGGAMWIYAFNLPASVWIGLIPIVAIERGLFTLGIAVSYVIMSKVLDYLTEKQLIPDYIHEIH
jgi:riboflavin transporter FmnP